MTLTSEQNAAQIKALIAERAGYLKYGKTERAAQVEAQLAALGAAGRTPAKRATKLSKK